MSTSRSTSPTNSAAGSGGGNAGGGGGGAPLVPPLVSTGGGVDPAMMFEDKDTAGLKPPNSDETPLMEKAERDDRGSRAWSVASNLIAKKPSDQLTLGLSLDDKGGVNYSDLNTIANRHVHNSHVLKDFRRACGQLNVLDYFPVLVPVSALESETNPRRRYVGCSALDIVNDFRKLDKGQVVSYGVHRAVGGKHAAGDERTLKNLTERYMDSYLKDSVDSAFEKEAEEDKCALLYLWIMLKKVLFMDEATVKLLLDWMEDVGTKGSKAYFGGNIKALGAAYVSVCKCLVEVNRLPKDAYKWLLYSYSKSKYSDVSGPFDTRYKNLQEKTLLQEIQLTVPEAEQKSTLADVEKLAKEGTQLFENLLSNNKISIPKTDPAMNAFGRTGGGAKSDDDLKSSDPTFKGVEVELKQYTTKDYKELSAKQRQLLRIKRKEAGLDPRTGKKKSGNYNRNKSWGKKEGESLNHAGGNSGTQIVDGKVVLSCKTCGLTSGRGAHTTKFCGMAKKDPGSFPAGLPGGHPYHAMAAKCTPVNDNGGSPLAQEGSSSFTDLTAKVDKLAESMAAMAAIQEQLATLEAKETESPERARLFEMISKAWKPLK